MKETHTYGGAPCYSIKLKTIFTLVDFCKALSEKSYSERIDFDNLKKRDAIALLKKSLEWHGRNGKFECIDDIGDDQDILNEEYEKAKQWVVKNYPYLNNKKQSNP